MSSGFIPMVSTTPPPIDDGDDDFGEFVDDTEHDDDDFGDFSSHVDNEDYSYSPMHSPPQIGNSMSFPSDDDFSPTKISTLNKGIFEIEKQNEKGIETILHESEKITEGHVGDFVSNQSDELDKPASASLNGFDSTCNRNSADGDLKMKSDFDNDSLDFEEGTFEGRTDNQIDTDSQVPTSKNLTQSSPQSDSQHKQSTQNEDSATFDKIQNPTVAPSNDFGEFTVNNIDSSPLKVSSTEGTGDEPEAHEEISQENSEQTGAVSSEQNVDVSDDSQEFADFDGLQNYDNAQEHKDSVSDTNNDDFQEYEKVENDANTEVNGDTVQKDAKNPVSNIISDSVSAEQKDEENIAEPDEFEANFADFQSVSHESENSTDPQSEVTCVSNSVTSAFSSENTVNTQDVIASTDNTFECDFADFESIDVNLNNEEFVDSSNLASSQTNDPKKTTENIDSDFGDFSTASNDDDFGDFNSGSDAPWPSTTIPVKKVLTIDEKVTSYVSKYTKRKDGDLSDESICLLDERMNSDILSKNDDNHSPVHGETLAISWPGELWDQLEDIDNTIALNFIWNGSGHNKLLLDSLGMHTQNILFSGSKQAYYVPTYYAAGLGLVDPNKGVLKPMSAAEKITAMSPTEKGAPAIQDELFPEAHPEWNSIADGHGSEKSTIVDESGSWTHGEQIGINSAFHCMNESAGDPIPIISSTMDLDYFDTLPTVQDGAKMSPNADLIDPELLELATAPTTEPPPPPKDSGTATLSKILASIKNTSQSPSPSISSTGDRSNSKWEEEEKKLSPEARSVLQKLPDISYMRSKVLVFPMNMSRVSIGEDV